MLGEKVGSIQAAATVKTLSAKNSRPVFEVSAQGAGSLGGGDVNIMAHIPPKYKQTEVFMENALMQVS